MAGLGICAASAAATGLPPRLPRWFDSALEANNGETLGQLAAEGVGIACVGAFSLASEITAGRLTSTLERLNPGDVEQIHAVFVGGSHMPARVRVFVDFLAEHLR